MRPLEDELPRTRSGLLMQAAASSNRICSCEKSTLFNFARSEAVLTGSAMMLAQAASGSGENRVGRTPASLSPSPRVAQIGQTPSKNSRDVVPVNVMHKHLDLSIKIGH